MVSEPIGFDACVLINLLVSGHAHDMIRATRSPAYICPAVRDEISLLGSDAGHLLPNWSPVDSLVDSGILAVAEIASETEEALYVEYSLRVGRGEAMTIALAHGRGWAVATDDRKARTIATTARLGLQCTVLTTPQIVKYWFESDAPTAARVGSVIRTIERDGRFRPARRHPLRRWWDSMKFVSQ